MSWATEIDYWLATLVIAGQALTVALLIAYALRNRVPAFKDVADTVGRWGILAGAGIALFAALMTLVYSDLFGFEPCPLCWWQRIFLYPQAILLGMAAAKRDAVVADYAIVLSVFGFGIAMYQHALQMLPGSGLPCPAVGASCSQRVIFEYGFVTFPLMAATVFALLFAIMLFVRLRRGA